MSDLLHHSHFSFFSLNTDYQYHKNYMTFCDFKSIMFSLPHAMNFSIKYTSMKETNCYILHNSLFKFCLKYFFVFKYCDTTLNEILPDQINATKFSCYINLLYHCSREKPEFALCCPLWTYSKDVYNMVQSTFSVFFLSPSHTYLILLPH